VDAPFYKGGIESNLQQNFYDVLSPANILLNLIPFFYSVSPFFFIKIVFDIIRFYSKWFKSERKTVQLEVEKLNLERDFLKAQLNPHFLFNTLNNLYGLSLRGDEQTPQVITQLSEMMRYTLYESNAEKVPVVKELQYLKNYVLLEKMRYKDNVDIACEIDDSNAGDLLIAPLLTFTFIENGFKYGLSKKNEGFLKINISIEGNSFYFSIINDKHEKSKPGKFGGIGLENARKRLGLLYPNKHTLTIEDGDKTFYVSLIINLQ
jgi:sensor histidine kinase YesM